MRNLARGGFGMKYIGFGLALIPLVCWTPGAAADCKSPTDELQSATIVYRCPPSDKPVDAAKVIVEPGNVSVIEKKADPVKLAEPVPAEPARPQSKPGPVEVKTVAAKPPQAEALRIKPSSAKPAQAKPRKAAARSTKQKRSKSTAQKQPQIIHLEKPSIGRRIIQFFSF